MRSAHAFPTTLHPSAPGFRWFIPSFHGDVRAVPNESDPTRTDLVVVKPTADEVRLVNAVCRAAVTRGWLPTWDDMAPRRGLTARKKWVITLHAPVVDVGPLVASIMRPGAAVLTAVYISDGRMETTSGGAAALVETLAPYRAPDPSQPPPPPLAPRTIDVPEPTPAAGQDPAPAPAARPEPVVAATVRRATPSCPQCVPGAIGPASEVLLAFLDEEQHARWARERTVVVDGGMSGHRYLLSHRHGAAARRWGRICYDTDDEVVVHFHDLTVPPEEEVLAAMLILRYREAWLRNEATLFHAAAARSVWKNPFGDVLDGTLDAGLMQGIGTAVLALAGAQAPPAPPPGSVIYSPLPVHLAG